MKKDAAIRALAALAQESQHPDLPAWPLTDGNAKLPAAWLIERCGLKGSRDGDVAISARHALVLVNAGAASGADLWRLALRVMHCVEERFGLQLEPEPRIYGAPALHDEQRLRSSSRSP